jgi:hypothetical protein
MSLQSLAFFFSIIASNAVRVEHMVALSRVAHHAACRSSTMVGSNPHVKVNHAKSAKRCPPICRTTISNSGAIG